MPRVLAEQCLIREEHRYHAHPHLAVLGSGAWLMVFNRGPRRAVTMHPPQDPEFVNLIMRSDDEGESWSPPMAAPAFGWTGVECAGLTPLGGRRVLMNQWRFRWHNVSAAPSRDDEPLLVGPDELKAGLIASTEIGDSRINHTPAVSLMPWARGGGSTWAHVSEDEGRSWTRSVEIATAPFAGGYGMRGALVLGDEIILPLSDVPHWRRIFIVRSRDGGASWDPPTLVAEDDAREFEEPSILALADGSCLMLMRDNQSRTLFSTRSTDAGRSWSRPTATGIPCYPAHLLTLPDGRVAAVTGRREPPFGIEIFVFDQRRDAWDVDRPIIARTGLPNRDLGYPTIATRRDGTLYIVHYHRDAEGVTGLHATFMAL